MIRVTAKNSSKVKTRQIVKNGSKNIKYFLSINICIRVRTQSVSGSENDKTPQDVEISTIHYRAPKKLRSAYSHGPADENACNQKK